MAEPKNGDGFVTITASSAAGMVDIHDRRPLVFSPECAAHWLDPELSPDEAECIALEHGLAADELSWYPIDRAVGKVKNERPQLFERINDPKL